MRGPRVVLTFAVPAAWLFALCICRTHLQAQIIKTIAGTTFTFPSSPLSAQNAPLGYVRGVAVDASGNVYAADSDNNLVVRFVPGGQMTVVAGNGIRGFSGDEGLATSASLNSPVGVAVDSAGNLYIADSGNNRIRQVSKGIITTIAGNGNAGFSGDGGRQWILSQIVNL